ncbi:RNA polymerase sigma factor [Spongiivirga sp. MCCC 1A20706]|uniref:RNA polymerase sigma factor n=1 Tax=Spongiivirga sp. MCCC 1A20706 TaxID=3160963 RepID=UPI0039779C5F
MEQTELIKACKANSYKAQIAVYELYKDMLYTVSSRIIGNDADAQDVVHDTFIKAFKSISTVSDESSLGSWLKRIVINQSLGFLKKNNRIKWVTLDKEIPEKIEVHSMPNLQIDNVMNAMGKLKDKYRIIIVLYLIEEYSHREIAQKLELNESTVRNQYKRGKEMLANILKEYKLS